MTSATAVVNQCRSREQPRLFLRLLGDIGAGPEQSRVHPAPGRVAGGVLAHLALACGRLVTSESLAASVWDEAPNSSRNAIQVAVFKLRRQYGADLIVSTRAGYLLGVPVRIDWTEAADLLQVARGHLRAGRGSEALTAAALAENLFCGEPLAGLTTISAEAARQRARDLLSSARSTRGAALISLGRTEEAIDVLRIEVDANPLGEPAHVALIEALASIGRSAEAVCCYEQLRRRLARTLGASPSSSTRACIARITGRDAPLLAHDALGTPDAAATPRF